MTDFNNKHERNIMYFALRRTSSVGIRVLNTSQVYFVNQAGQDIGWFASLHRYRGDPTVWEVYRPNFRGTSNANSHIFWKSFDDVLEAAQNVEWQMHNINDGYAEEFGLTENPDWIRQRAIQEYLVWLDRISEFRAKHDAWLRCRQAELQAETAEAS